MPAKKRTATQHAEVQKDRAPIVKLVPDKAGGDYPKAQQTACGATAYQSGVHVACELKALHPGDHEYAGVQWRRRSGDAR